jgi:replicative DNA helicase
MAKIDKNSLGYLGFDYQVRLMAQILTDRIFANSIIDIVDPNYFEDPYLRIIAATVKDAKREDDIIPDVGSLEFRLLEDVKEDIQRKYVLAQLQKVKDANLNDTLKVQDIAMRFCKQQELKKSIKEITKIIDKGNLEDYEQCETILRKALEHGDSKEDGIDVFTNINEVLADDYRNPIRTGIKGLDDVMNGGLSKGELAVILAPFGVGKTTMMTKIANTALFDGKRVVQIFFEDMPKIIQRKHLSCWTGYPLNDLGLHKEQINTMVAEMIGESSEKGKGSLTLKKFPSDGTTMPMIKAYLRKLIAQGLRPDIVLLDYIDCVIPSKHYDDVNVGEGAIMRQFESMLAELDIAGWTAVQGNRSSIKSEVVEADQMSGSIKKGMIGHFIVSIAKTLDQKENGTATMAILKSRFGKDGLIFPDIIFDNSRIQIEMGENKKGARTQTEYKRDTVENNQARINSVLEAAKNRKSVISGPTETVGEIITIKENEIK